MTIGVYVAGYNCGLMARSCVRSLLSQTCRDWQACVVDDCSTDDTARIAIETANGDSRVRVMRNPSMVHSCRSKLRAIDALSGCEILVGLDLDDWLRDDALGRIEAEHRGGAWVTYGSWQTQAGHPGPTPTPVTPETWARRRPANGGDGWFLTAPNTFRSFLLSRIPRERWQWTDGRGWYETGFDGALMLAVTDLAGMDRTRCIENRVYFYRTNSAVNVCRTRSVEYRATVIADQYAHPPLEQLP